VKKSIVFSSLLAAAVLLTATAGEIPAPPSIAIEVLLRTTLSGDDSKEVLVASAEFPVGGGTGRHTHPGDEYATVLAGTLELLVEGQPPRRINAGESYHNARNVVHETKNAGDGPARVLATFVVDKGQKLMQPASGS